MDSDKQIDITTYPEGFDEVIKSLDFLPDDYATRVAYIVGYATTLMFC